MTEKAHKSRSAILIIANDLPIVWDKKKAKSYTFFLHRGRVYIALANIIKWAG
jgi:hypothetical protein